MSYLEIIVTILAVEHLAMAIRFLFKDRRCEKQSKIHKNAWDELMKDLINVCHQQDISIKALTAATRVAQQSWNKLEKQLGKQK